MKKIIIAIVVVLVILGLYVGVSYNSLITSNENVNTQWSKVEAQYQRRFDLIPNIVNSVKGSMKQEQQIFSAIAEARTKYAGAKSVDERVRGANQVDSAVSRLLLVMENYPDLKSNTNVQALIAELAGTENRITVERTRFNDYINSYNLGVKRFPKSIIAAMFGFDERPYFKSAEGAQNAPQVNF